MDKLLPAKITERSALDKLSEVRGNGRTVYLSISEDIQVSAPDPASEIELKKLLLALGFEVVDTRSKAAFAIICEAVASNAGQYQKFNSASARVELSIYSGKDNKLLARGSQKLSPQRLHCRVDAVPSNAATITFATHKMTHALRALGARGEGGRGRGAGEDEC